MKINRIPDLEWPDDVNYDGQCQTLPVSGNVVAIQVVNRKKAFGTILHESVHVWQGIMEYIAESNPGIETEAYTIEYITITLMREYEHLTGEKLALPTKRKTRLQTREGLGPQA